MNLHICLLSEQYYLSQWFMPCCLKHHYDLWPSFEGVFKFLYTWVWHRVKVDDLCVQPVQISTILKRLSYLSTHRVNVFSWWMCHDQIMWHNVDLHVWKHPLLSRHLCTVHSEFSHSKMFVQVLEYNCSRT